MNATETTRSQDLLLLLCNVEFANGLKRDLSQAERLYLEAAGQEIRRQIRRRLLHSDTHIGG